MRPALALLLLAPIAACTATLPLEVPLDPPVLAKAENEAPKPPPQIIEVPKPLPLPGQLKPRPKPASEKKAKPPEETMGAANAAAKIEPSASGYINAMQVYPFTEGALYHLYAAVNQVSDIALEPGEKLISVSSGDTVWVIGDTTSGEGGSQRTHIMVKPSAPDLATNLVITTDRRTYHLDLSSTEKTYIASLSWTYPLSALTALKADAAKQALGAQTIAEPGVAIENLHFRYRIEGEAPWRPVQVFDDGNKVYIQFPSTLGQGEAPPLFVLGSGDKPALVNYRLKGSTYVVDRLFAAAELRLGEAPQRTVRITRIDAREPSGERGLWP
jgi:type IV secretion system protein TrbG